MRSSWGKPALDMVWQVSQLQQGKEARQRLEALRAEEAAVASAVAAEEAAAEEAAEQAAIEAAASSSSVNEVSWARGRDATREYEGEFYEAPQTAQRRGSQGPGSTGAPMQGGPGSARPQLSVVMTDERDRQIWVQPDNDTTLPQARPPVPQACEEGRPTPLAPPVGVIADRTGMGPPGRRL